VVPALANNARAGHPWVRRVKRGLRQKGGPPANNARAGHPQLVGFDKVKVSATRPMRFSGSAAGTNIRSVYCVQSAKSPIRRNKRDKWGIGPKLRSYKRSQQPPLAPTVDKPVDGTPPVNPMMPVPMVPLLTLTGPDITKPDVSPLSEETTKFTTMLLPMT